MLKTALISLLIIVFFSSINGQSTQLSPQAGLENMIKKEKAVGVAAGILQAGEVLWKNAAGYQDCEAKIPFSDTTRTRLASIAKPMTAIAIMQLVEQGKIDLDTDIRVYLPNFPQKNATAVTTRMLLAHTSGLGGYANAKEAQNETEYPTLTAAFDMFKERDLAFAPGTNFGYTTYGYIVLGLLIEQITGLTYEQYMQQNIWDKADMTQTGIERVGVVYDNKSKLYHAKKRKAVEAKQNNLSNRIPGGGFYSTLNDLFKFGAAVLNNTLISEASFKTMTQISFPQPESNPYGLGWFLYGTPPNESGVIGHGGGQTGANTQLLIKPTTQTVVVVLNNTSGTKNASILYAVDLLRYGKDMEKL